MRTRKYILPSYILTAITACAVHVSVARAYLLISPSVQGLVENSTAIVEAEVVSGTPDALQVRVTRVYRGEMKNQDVITIDASSYRKSIKFIQENGTATKDDFDAGDRLICFLGIDRGAPKVPSDGKKTFDAFGFRMISGDSVVDFSQFNSGPLIAELWPEFDKRGVPYGNFRLSLAEKIQKNDAAMAAVQKAIAEKDSRRILTIMQHLPATDDVMIHGENLVARVATDSLNALHDYPVLVDAVEGYQVEPGFRTAEGREFLLKTIADGKVDISRRIACTNVLPGSVYPSDPHYATRLAQIAADNVNSPEFFMALIGKGGGYGATLPPTDPDIIEAMKILVKVYQTSTNESIRYCIEGAIRSGGSQDAYAALHPLGGPMVSIVRFDYSDQTKPVVGKPLLVDIVGYMYFPDRAAHTLQTEFMLQPVAGGNAISGGPGQPIDSRYPSLYGQQVTIPQTIQPGKYRAYFRYSENNKIVGQSHFAELDIQGQ